MKIRSIGTLAVCLVLFATAACKKDAPLHSGTEIVSYDLISVQADVTIGNSERKISVRFPDEVVEAGSIIADFTLSEGAAATVGSTLQVSGKTTNNFEAPLVYDILAEDGISRSIWEIRPVNNSYTDAWGLGGFTKTPESNNRGYSWYFDQATSGTFAGINCGPTSTTMAAKWHDQEFVKLPSDARSAYRPEGGWWYTSDINNYLNDNNIPHYFIGLSTNAAGTGNIIRGEIDKGNIVILCLDMYYITAELSVNYHVGKFYTTSAEGWGHFIVVKGYREVDRKLFLEVYDPYCYGKSYTDGQLKGIDRYYSSPDIYAATSIWWNNAIIIPPKGTKGIPDNAIDPSAISHQAGR